MLVLSRKLGERIVLPTIEVTVTVLAIKGNTIRLGFTAPDNIDIYREEVWQDRSQETNHSTTPE